ncbi:MAG TPA: tail fiber domain-containing protein [Candidatus Cybelea sp.]|nr:tail fiber domain-containing protein [Candidatus Cybelea sp.]
MNSKLRPCLIVLASLALSIFNSELSIAFAQGTAFSYEGQLMDTGATANGLYDLQFILYDASVGGSQVGPILTNTATPVSNGLFTVVLNFGPGIFTGANYWLDLAARTNGTSLFIELSPRQELTPTPYTIFAEGANAAGLIGTIPLASLSGTYSNEFNLTNAGNSFAGNGAGLANVNAVTLSGLSSAAFWRTNGNAGANPTNGAFLGTTDNNPLEIHVDGMRALRLEPAVNAVGEGAPNVIGGSSLNSVSSGIFGATIGGGGCTNYAGLGAYINKVTGDFGTVAGGYSNTVSSPQSTVSGGFNNTASGAGGATVAGGDDNTASGGMFGLGTVGGGSLNTASGDWSTVSGGNDNQATDFYAAVPGGEYNIAGGYCSFAAGEDAQAGNDNCFVWSDSDEIDGFPSAFSSTADNQFLIHAGGGVGIGTNGPQAQLHVSSSGGNSFPQAQLDQQNTSGTSRLRFTLGGNVNQRWDLGATTTEFVIYSGSIGANMILLNSSGLTVNGTFVSKSDRNVKAGFESVDAKTVLAKVAAMPITRWHYTNDAATPHLGPMAQDFHAAFNLGTDDKHIATVDEEGVALAAIQGLNQKVEDQWKEKDLEIARLKAKADKVDYLQKQNESLAARLSELEATVKELAARK